MCCGSSKEPSHLDGSFEYPQHMFWMINKDDSFPTRTLISRPASLNASEGEFYVIELAQTQGQ